MPSDDRQTKTKTPPIQVHTDEATIKFLVVLLQYIQIFYKIHKNIKAKEEVCGKSTQVCVLT